MITPPLLTRGRYGNWHPPEKTGSLSTLASPPQNTSIHSGTKPQPQSYSWFSKDGFVSGALRDSTSIPIPSW